jgi:TolA-binding protein
MKAPRTRVDEATTELERELLRSWSAERPSSAARRRALGVAVGAAGAAAASSAAGATGAALANGVAPKATAAVLLAAAKWLAAGGLVVTGALVARPYLSHEAARPAAAVAAAPPRRAPALAPPAAAAPALAPPAAAAPRLAPPAAGLAPPEPANAPAAARAPSEPEHQRHVSRERRAANPRAVVAAPAAEAPATVAEAPAPEPKRATRELGEQVASLDRAGRALAAGEAAEALRLIDEYQARFPTGSLLQEATVVRVDALLALGRRADATAVAATFLSSHPTSPYAAKLRRRLERTPIP